MVFFVTLLYIYITWQGIKIIRAELWLSRKAPELGFERSPWPGIVVVVLVWIIMSIAWVSICYKEGIR